MANEIETPMANGTEGFVQEWSQFLVNLDRVASVRLARRDRVYRQELQPLLREVVDELGSDEGLDAIREELDRQQSDDIVMRDRLRRELHFFNQLSPSLLDSAQYQSQGYRGTGESSMPSSDKALGDAIGAGQTIKDSLESWLSRLPDKWKKGLKVLNEILSIAKGGS
jgi:hypothetical protein